MHIEYAMLGYVYWAVNVVHVILLHTFWFVNAGLCMVCWAVYAGLACSVVRAGLCMLSCACYTMHAGLRMLGQGIRT
jgi:hypothetical protein